MIIGVIVAIALVAAGLAAMTLRRKRCPLCHHRTLAVHRRAKRAVCVNCKAEFAHVDGGYVPIKPIVVPEAKS